MTKKIRLTTAQALIKFLNQQYIHIDGEEFPFVEGIFTVFGHGNVLGIGQALEENPGHLKVFQGKNEQGMSHAAIAYSKQSLRRKIYAVTASAGPGSANMVTAAATAFANNIPLLLLPADTFASRQPDPVLQQLEVESSIALTTNDAFRPVSRYWDRVQRPEQLMSALIRAFEVMTNPATAGPATICIAQDTEGEAYEYDCSFFEKRVHYMNRTEPTSREITGAIEQIKAAKYPVLVVGGGARYSGAGSILEHLSERCNIPIVETHAGKSTVADTFKNNLGGTGVLGTAAANEIVRKSDLIIGIGTKYNDFVTSSKTAYSFGKTNFLTINVSRMQTYKFDGFQVVGDARVTLEKISLLLGNYQTQFGTLIHEVKENWKKERERLASITFDSEAFTPEISGHFTQEVMNEYAQALNSQFTQTAAFLTINNETASDSIAVASAGSLPGDMQRLWESSEPNTYHLEYGYSCMGYEIAGALGVKLAQPEQEVYAMVGDGSFLMLHSELVTALQYKQKINIMLFDNSGFGCINNLQMSNGSGSYMCEFRTSDNEIMSIDYAKIAEGYGLKAYRVRNQEELVQALNDSKKETGPVLFDIKVLPKTMSDGYDSWWHVGVAEVSGKETIKKAYEEKESMLKDAWKY
ncbi:3D-(3,5/4)-trihydroxycyclohexane-1,2-dione acylhydrolase (decyclizing) [Enterococcus sp. AZ194]|uniref:3D-(3,5/4)-trihydroxycyclohexane-1,2-dione acylhydrolase (decyclizing) n=1 Tax=Enterococcus sp. AZ194 TaxID=2774629 RepID=UPI003F275DAF